jgi:hypothetical protein
MDKRPAAKQVAAERFIVVVIEQVRNVGAYHGVLREPIAAVEIKDAIARNGTDINPRQPLERIHPAVLQCAAEPTARVRRPSAELMARGVGQQWILGYVADARMEAANRFGGSTVSSVRVTIAAAAGERLDGGA